MDSIKKYLLAFVAILTLITGIAGFMMAGFDAITAVYRSIQLFVLEGDATLMSHSVLLTTAYFVAPSVTAGAIINIILYLTKNQIKTLKVKHYKDHVIICGLSQQALLIVDDFIKEGKKLVVIELNSHHDKITWLEKKGVVVFEGNAEDEGMLNKAGVTRASYLMALTLHDELNIGIANIASKICMAHGNGSTIVRKALHKLRVIVHISDYYNYEIFKNYHEIAAEGKIIDVDFHAFNLHKKAAASMIDENRPDKQVPVKSESDPQAHILIQGINNDGINLIIEAAHEYHFANLKKLRVTVVDDNVDQQLNGLLLKYPFITKIIEITALEKRLFYQMMFTNRVQDVSVAFICEPSDSACILYYKKLRQVFFSMHKDLKHPLINVLLPQDTSINTLFENIQREAKDLHVKLYYLYSDFCTKSIVADDMEVYDNIAMQIHNLYLETHLKGDDLKASWDKLTDFQKDFNRFSARHFAIKLSYLGCEIVDKKDERPVFDLDTITDEEKLMTGKMEHNRWVAEKLINGFVPGEDVHDKKLQGFLKNTLKYHRDIRPWNELDKADKDKDFTSFENIKVILDGVNKKVVKSI